MKLFLIVFGLLWVVLGAISLLLGGAYGLDRIKVKENLSNLKNISYLKGRGIFLSFLEFFAAYFWIPIAYPFFGFTIGFIVLILFI